MGLLGGPSKGVLLQMSQGIASIAMQIKMLHDLDEDAKKLVIESMVAEDTPVNMGELVATAALIISQQNMGWYKKNQFLGMIYGSLISMGITSADANYIKGQIELLSS